jgi:hypothetical protein
MLDLQKDNLFVAPFLTLTVNEDDIFSWNVSLYGPVSRF